MVTANMPPPAEPLTSTTNVGAGMVFLDMGVNNETSTDVADGRGAGDHVDRGGVTTDT